MIRTFEVVPSPVMSSCAVATCIKMSIFITRMWNAMCYLVMVFTYRFSCCNKKDLLIRTNDFIDEESN